MSLMHDGRTRWPHDWPAQPAPASQDPADTIIGTWTWWVEQATAAWMALAEQAVQATIAAWDIHGPGGRVRP